MPFGDLFLASTERAILALGMPRPPSTTLPNSTSTDLTLGGRATNTVPAGIASEPAPRSSICTRLRSQFPLPRRLDRSSNLPSLPTVALPTRFPPLRRTAASPDLPNPRRSAMFAAIDAGPCTCARGGLLGTGASILSPAEITAAGFDPTTNVPMGDRPGSSRATATVALIGGCGARRR